MNFIRVTVTASLLFVFTSFATLAQAPTSKLKPEVEAFIAQMVANHRFEAPALRTLFGQIKPHEGVIKAIRAPSTAKPWHEFRSIFVTPTRTSGGVAFWNDHAGWLERAREAYGVPEEIIVSIIGVETIYGKRLGSFRVMDALYTLGFELPERAPYFRGETEQFLLMTRENALDPLDVKGSFAGAMGLPQFMPTSYRKYAVDFDGDGRIDLWNSIADVIGSVANYLRVFGWTWGDPVTASARISGEHVKSVLEAGLKPHMSLEQLLQKGVEPVEPLHPDTPAGLFTLEAVEGPEYWLAFNNFYVITRYNRSRNYAMAVHQLAEAIARERALQNTPPVSAANP
jgi:membrane-bound lytic murein transglycosylase B